MNKVITINLGGRAYQLEEGGYEALREYLSRAEATLAENPDKSEIIRDLETAIAEKCDRYLSPGKNVVMESEVARIIDEMGPVGGAKSDDSGAKKSGTASKKLYLIREGAVICGVATGLAAYLGLDVTIVRVAFVALTVLTGGGFIFGYIAMAVLIPYADTGEEKAAARGLPFNAQELIDRAKKSYAEFESGSWKHWRDEHIGKHMRRAREERSRSESRASEYAHYRYEYPRRGGNRLSGFLSVLLGIAWVVALLSLISSGTIYGWSIPAGVPVWVAIIILFLVYHAVSGPLKASRYSRGGYGYDGWAGVEDALGILFIVIAFVFAYAHYPAVHDTVNGLPERIREWWHSRGH